jgi:hypothetical protein
MSARAMLVHTARAAPAVLRPRLSGGATCAAAAAASAAAAAAWPPPLAPRRGGPCLARPPAAAPRPPRHGAAFATGAAGAGASDDGDEEDTSKPLRVERLLANLGYGKRQECAALVKRGRVTLVDSGRPAKVRGCGAGGGRGEQQRGRSGLVTRLAPRLPPTHSSPPQVPPATPSPSPTR